MNDWIEKHAGAIAARAPRELEALVAVSSPSGDVHGAEEAAAVAAALAPDEAEVERVPCSSADHAPDLLVRLPRHRRQARPAPRPRRHRHRARRPSAAAPRGRPARRLGHGRHEGRRRPRPRASCARWSSAARTSPRRRCCSCATRSGASGRSSTSSASPASTPACASRAASAPRTAHEQVIVRRKAAGTVMVNATGRIGALGLRPASRDQRAARPRGRAPRRSRRATTPTGPST